MSSDTLSKYVAKPASAFVIGAAATQLMMGGDQGITIGGVFVPMWAFGGLASAAGVELGQVVNDYVAPHVTSITLLSAPVHTALNIAIGATATALAYHMAAGGNWSDTVGITSVLGIAAVAEVGSGYATSMWWQPMLQQYA
jgi:hypothetical protein